MAEKQDTSPVRETGTITYHDLCAIVAMHALISARGAVIGPPCDIVERARTFADTMVSARGAQA